jgi:DNA-binding MarR family transcriptional regulator
LLGLPRHARRPAAGFTSLQEDEETMQSAPPGRTRRAVGGASEMLTCLAVPRNQSDAYDIEKTAFDDRVTLLTTGFPLWKLVVMSGAGPETLTQLTLTVFRLNGALLQWGDALVAPLGLTIARWQLLGALAPAGKPLTAPQVGQSMGVTRQGAQKQLNLLVDQRLVEARPNPSHRRSPLYALTPRGRDVYTQGEALWIARATELATRFSSSQLRTAGTTLATLLQHLDVEHTQTLA